MLYYSFVSYNINVAIVILKVYNYVYNCRKKEKKIGTEN
jgi:hypothetical protein